MVTLNFTGVTEYQVVTGGSIQITNVVDHTTGVSYTGANPQLIGVLSNNTLCFTIVNESMVLVTFNETAPANIDYTQSWIRMIDLGTDSNLVTLAYTNGAIASYVGSLVNTQYQTISPNTTTLRVYYSTGGSYNSPLITLDSALNASDAYTVFYFTPASGSVASLVFDRDFLGWTQSTASTTGMMPKATTGLAQMTSGVVISSTASSTAASTAVSSTSTSSSSSTTTSGSVTQPHESSSTQLVAGVIGFFALMLTL